MNDRCKYQVCDEDDDHDPECTAWKTNRNLDGEDAPYPGMATAFEVHYGQSWTDPDWRKEAATWAAAWKAALSHNVERNRPGGGLPPEGPVHGSVGPQRLGKEQA